MEVVERLITTETVIETGSDDNFTDRRPVVGNQIVSEESDAIRGVVTDSDIQADIEVELPEENARA